MGKRQANNVHSTGLSLGSDNSGYYTTTAQSSFSPQRPNRSSTRASDSYDLDDEVPRVREDLRSNDEIRRHVAAKNGSSIEFSLGLAAGQGDYYRKNNPVGTSKLAENRTDERNALRDRFRQSNVVFAAEELSELDGGKNRSVKQKEIEALYSPKKQVVSEREQKLNRAASYNIITNEAGQNNSNESKGYYNRSRNVQMNNASSYNILTNQPLE